MKDITFMYISWTLESRLGVSVGLKARVCLVTVPYESYCMEYHHQRWCDRAAPTGGSGGRFGTIILRWGFFRSCNKLRFNILWSRLSLHTPNYSLSFHFSCFFPPFFLWTIYAKTTQWREGSNLVSKNVYFFGTDYWVRKKLSVRPEKRI